MAVYDPRPLSMVERMELAAEKRKEAECLIEEAERIEKGIIDDNERIRQAIETTLKNKEE